MKTKTKAFLQWNIDPLAFSMTVYDSRVTESIKQTQELCLRLSEQAKLDPLKYGASGNVQVRPS
jgi:hypothetical protein